MKQLAWLGIVIGIISLVIGVISRVMVIPVPITPVTSMEAHAFLQFSGVCFLFSIAMALMAQAKK